MSYKKPLLLLVGFLFLLANGSIYAEHKTQHKDCILGVFPFLSAQRLESIFAPIAAELNTVINCEIRYQSTPSFKIFMERLEQQKYGIAFVQPFDYVRIAAKNGYIPLVTYSENLHAVIVTKASSNINTVHDLKGKTIALPPPVAAVSYLTRAMLEKAGIDPLADVTLIYTKNHGSCMQQVLIGKADACGTAPPPVRLFQKNNQLKLKQIAISAPIPHALFVVRDIISDELLDKLQQKMLNIKLSDNAQKLFIKKGTKNPFRLVTDNEYDIVRDYWSKCKATEAP
jgi:phosphonate transport system substrate-binding protein